MASPHLKMCNLPVYLPRGVGRYGHADRLWPACKTRMRWQINLDLANAGPWNLFSKGLLTVDQPDSKSYLPNSTCTSCSRRLSKQTYLSVGLAKPRYVGVLHVSVSEASISVRALSPCYNCNPLPTASRDRLQFKQSVELKCRRVSAHGNTALPTAVGSSDSFAACYSSLVVQDWLGSDVNLGNSFNLRRVIPSSPARKKKAALTKLDKGMPN